MQQWGGDTTNFTILSAAGGECPLVWPYFYMNYFSVSGDNVTATTLDYTINENIKFIKNNAVPLSSHF